MLFSRERERRKAHRTASFCIFFHLFDRSPIGIWSASQIDEGTIHDMRRTCITNWARDPELKPKDVQVLAGHEDIQTTLAVYTIVEEDDVVEKQKRIIRRRASAAFGRDGARTGEALVFIDHHDLVLRPAQFKQPLPEGI